jgi:peptide/nickel transport system permease protein
MVIAYALRRIPRSLITILAVSVIIFVLYRLIPNNAGTAVLGSTATPEQLAEFSAQPAIVQYFRLLGQWVTGNFGYFGIYNQPVSTIILNALSVTCALVLGALVLTVLIGVPLGMIQGLRRNRPFDRVSTIVAFVFMSTPLFFSGQVLLYWFTYRIPVLPAQGPGDTRLLPVLAGFSGLILPIVVLTLPSLGRLSRITRSSVLDQTYADYIRTAQAKGCAPTRIVWGHMLRNSMILVLTFIGVSLPYLFSGALVVESLFNIQGLGYLLWQAAMPKHLYFPIEIAIVLVVSVVTVFGNLVVDLLLFMVDPRIEE